MCPINSWNWRRNGEAWAVTTETKDSLQVYFVSQVYSKYVLLFAVAVDMATDVKIPGFFYSKQSWV